MRRSSLAGRAGLYTVPQPFNLSTKARNKQRDARAQVTFHTLSRARMTDRSRLPNLRVQQTGELS